MTNTNVQKLSMYKVFALMMDTMTYSSKKKYIK